MDAVDSFDLNPSISIRNRLDRVCRATPYFPAEVSLPIRLVSLLTHWLGVCARGRPDDRGRTLHLLGLSLRFLLVYVGAAIWCGEAQAGQSITLAWNPNTEADVIGYRLYYGLAPRNYLTHLDVLPPDAPATNVAASVSGLLAGRTYYFAVTALNRDGAESDYSEEVLYTVRSPAVLPVVTESIVSETVPDILSPPPTATDEVIQPDVEPTPDPDPAIGPASASEPRIQFTPIGQPVTAFHISFDLPANRPCELQMSEDLVNWRLFIPFPPGAPVRKYVLTDLMEGAPMRFYRLLIP